MSYISPFNANAYAAPASYSFSQQPSYGGFNTPISYGGGYSHGNFNSQSFGSYENYFQPSYGGFGHSQQPSYNNFNNYSQPSYGGFGHSHQPSYNNFNNYFQPSYGGFNQNMNQGFGQGFGQNFGGGFSQGLEGIFSNLLQMVSGMNQGVSQGNGFNFGDNLGNLFGGGGQVTVIDEIIDELIIANERPQFGQQPFIIQDEIIEEQIIDIPGRQPQSVLQPQPVSQPQSQMPNGVTPDNTFNPTEPEIAIGAPIGAGDGGRVWGDPHFVGADGGNFDVMGTDGGVYNILSDAGFQYNAEFGDIKNDGKTFLTKAGFTIKDKQTGIDAQVQFTPDGTLLINGEEKGDGTYQLPNGGSISKDGTVATIETAEYSVRLDSQGDHFDQDITIKKDGVAMDGVMPHGLWGQTVDGDGEARNGDEGAGAQGGGAIDTVGANGEVVRSERGDKEAVENYRVDGLFDTNKLNFANKFYTQANPGNSQAQVGAGQRGQGF